MENNPLRLEGRNYLVTGAASGMGRVTAILLSSYGARLILVDINAEGLEETRLMCKTECKVLAFDLTDVVAIKEKVMQAVAESGRINGFVHLAGIPYISPLKTVNAAVCEKVYRVNTYAAIELAKVFTNKKVYAGENGSVVLISSVYGLVGSPANVGYAMSKSAIQGITKALAIELAPKRIRVNCIAPGFIRTDMLDKVSASFSEDYLEHLSGLHPLGLGEAKDVAYAILYLLSDMACWVTGTVLNVDGGFTAQ